MQMRSVRESCGFDFDANLRTVLRNIFADVGGAVLQQEVADDGERRLHDEGAVVGGKLLRGDAG